MVPRAGPGTRLRAAPGAAQATAHSMVPKITPDTLHRVAAGEVTGIPHRVVPKTILSTPQMAARLHTLSPHRKVAPRELLATDHKAELKEAQDTVRKVERGTIHKACPGNTMRRVTLATLHREVQGTHRVVQDTPRRMNLAIQGVVQDILRIILFPVPKALVTLHRVDLVILPREVPAIHHRVDLDILLRADRVPRKVVRDTHREVQDTHREVQDTRRVVLDTHSPDRDIRRVVLDILLKVDRVPRRAVPDILHKVDQTPPRRLVLDTHRVVRDMVRVDRDMLRVDLDMLKVDRDTHKVALDTLLKEDQVEREVLEALDTHPRVVLAPLHKEDLRVKHGERRGEETMLSMIRSLNNARQSGKETAQPLDVVNLNVSRRKVIA